MKNQRMRSRTLIGAVLYNKLGIWAHIRSGIYWLWMVGFEAYVAVSMVQDLFVDSD